MKDDLVYILHIKECLEEIDEFVKNGKTSFLNERLIRNATLRSLQVLSESMTKISNELKQQNPAIPWRKIQGFRNILVHDYLGIDHEIIWLVIEKELPQIAKLVDSLLAGP